MTIRIPRSPHSPVVLGVALLVATTICSAAPTSGRGSAKPPPAPVAYTVKQLAEMCVDQQVLFSISVGMRRYLDMWFTPRLVALGCPLSTKCAAVETELNPMHITFPDDVTLRASATAVTQIKMQIGMELAHKKWLQTQGGMTAESLVADMLQWPEWMGKPSAQLEWQWVTSRSDTWVAVVAAVSKALAPTAADATFQKRRDELVAAGVKALETDPGTTAQFRKSLAVSPALAEARRKLCQRLAAASAKLEGQ